MPGVLTVVGDVDGNPSPVAAPATDQQIFFGEDFDMPAWIDVEPLSPVSTGPDSAFEQMTLPPPSQATLPLPSRRLTPSPCALLSPLGIW